MLYRIITEDLNREKLLALTALNFHNFTVIEAIGYYNGKQEKSLIIEIDDLNENTINPLDLQVLCAKINYMNKQQCTLLQVIKSKSELVFDKVKV